MAFQDKAIQCSECGTTFTFSAQEQEEFKVKGYVNEPKRCPACRQARKTERGASRQMFPITCASCGKATEVPFQPRGDKPVYCSDCYRLHERGQMDPKK